MAGWPALTAGRSRMDAGRNISRCSRVLTRIVNLLAERQRGQRLYVDRHERVSHDAASPHVPSPGRSLRISQPPGEPNAKNIVVPCFRIVLSNSGSTVRAEK